MTDLHCHILPGMDDGAPDLETAARLLEMEALQGVHRVALTSHFDWGEDTIDAFLERRAAAFDRLRSHLDQTEPEKEMELKLGCEIMFSPHLINEPVHRLCLEGTDLLLLELPVDRNPPFVQDALEYFLADGLIPVLAHVERYRYLLEDPSILARWVELGVVAHVNGASLVRDGEQAEMAMRFIKWNLVQTIATDTHSPHKRPPILRQALRKVDEQLGKQKAAWLRQNADLMFGGERPDYHKPHYPRRILGKWL